MAKSFLSLALFQPIEILMKHLGNVISTQQPDICRTKRKPHTQTHTAKNENIESVKKRKWKVNCPLEKYECQGCLINSKINIWPWCFKYRPEHNVVREYKGALSTTTFDILFHPLKCKINFLLTIVLWIFREFFFCVDEWKNYVCHFKIHDCVCNIPEAPEGVLLFLNDWSSAVLRVLQKKNCICWK